MNDLARRKTGGPDTNSMDAWSERIDRAAEKRSKLGFALDNAYRLMDGAGDDAPGVFIDVFAGRWLVQTWAATLPAGLSEALTTRRVAWWWKRLDPAEKSSPLAMSEPGGVDPFLVVENGLHFEISFRSGYSQGLFLDQRNNRRRVREQASPDQRILNLFAYTGGFSVAAATGGAITTTVDLSGPYLDWSKRNFTHNGLDPATHYFIKGDALDWLGAFVKKQRVFDGIVLDPPTFGRIKGGGVWRAEKDYQHLVEAAARALAPGGWMFCSANCRGMDRRRFESQLRAGFAAASRTCSMEHSPMPPDFTGEPYLLNAWCSSASTATRADATAGKESRHG
jgi:23S rRNA (cytosine1962-C5)-methyltransferase